jgi:hypothetical protein
MPPSLVLVQTPRSATENKIRQILQAQGLPYSDNDVKAWAGRLDYAALAKLARSPEGAPAVLAEMRQQIKTLQAEMFPTPELMAEDAPRRRMGLR